MASNTTRTYITIDANGKPAAAEIGKVEKAAQGLDEELDDVADSGRMDGLNEGIDGLFQGLSKSAGPLAAGGLIAGLGVIVNEAKDAAIEAGTIATALDTTVEEASRLRAAFGDVGIEADELTDIALQIGGAVSEDTELAQRLGLTIAEAQQPVEALKAGIESWDFLSAQERAMLFGEEGVRQIARLVAEGKSLDDILAEVSDARVMSAEDVERAIELENTIADVKGLVEQLTLQIGGPLIDAINLAVEATGYLAEAYSSMVGTGVRDELVAELRESKGVTDELTVATEEATAAGVEGFGEVKDAVAEVKSEYDLLTGQLSDREAWLKLQAEIDTVREKGLDAWFATESGAIDAEEKVRDHELAVIDLQQQVGEYGDEVLALPDEELTELILNVPDLAQTEADLSTLTRARTVTVSINAAIGRGWDAIGARARAISGSTGQSAGGNDVGASSQQNITVNFPRTVTMRELDASMANWKRANG